MPRHKPPGQHDFSRILEARARVAAGEAEESTVFASDASAQIHEILCDVQPAWGHTRDLPAPEPGHLYEDSAPLRPGVPDAVLDQPASASPIIADELHLTGELTPEELGRIRRAFALSNHPDLVAEPLREGATRRMMTANALIDQALKQKRNHPA